MEQIELVKTMKLRIHPSDDTVVLFRNMTGKYRDACNFVSEYIFNHDFRLSFRPLHDALYHELRNKFGLKSQMAISVVKTVIARYKTIETQLMKKPFRYKDENNEWHSILKTLELLQKPVVFSRPQADLVRGRDYSFVDDGNTLSVNTLGKRVRMSFDNPKCFAEYFNGSWTFGTGKLVSMHGNWYLHISVKRNMDDSFNRSNPDHIVGIDRGLRFVMTTYDDTGKCKFFSGKKIMEKRERFLDVRAQLQAKGTRSAKRKLKALSGRENRWMTDVNHQLSKTLVRNYGPNTLFVIEDLTGVSFSERNLNNRGKKQRNELRSWSFYQLEEMLTYKAMETGSFVFSVSPAYTSQRCPKCGRIRKENRKYEIHEYVCDACKYRSNDDRIGGMNLMDLGKRYVAGEDSPRIAVSK